MRKSAIIFTVWGICLFIALPGSKKPHQDGIEITYPGKNGVAEGYYLPVSWKDYVVESSKIPYPDNYYAQDRKYFITVSDKNGNTILENTVSGQNYWVFTHYDIKDILKTGIYYVDVEESTSRLSSTMRFFYKRPLGELSDFNEISQETASDQTEYSTESIATASSKGSCPHCWSYNWYGMLVVLVGATQHNKLVSAYCNDINWFTETRAPSFSGPVFINLPAGENYTVSYNDSVYDLYVCIGMSPWRYTLVIFP